MARSLLFLTVMAANSMQNRPASADSKRGPAGGAAEGLRRARRGRRGMTYAEVLVGATLLTLAMASFFQVAAMARQVRWNAHGRYMAVLLANNRIERAKNLRLEELPLLAESDTRVDARRPSGRRGGPFFSLPGSGGPCY